MVVEEQIQPLDFNYTSVDLHAIVGCSFFLFFFWESSWLFLLLYIRGHVDQDQTKIKNWTKTKMTFLENRTILKYKKDIEPHIIKLFILGGWHSGPSSSFRCSKTYILFWQLVMLVFFTHYLTVWIILILYQRVRDQIDTFEKLMTQLTFNLKIRN